MDCCQVSICPKCEKPYDNAVVIEVCKECGEPEASEHFAGDEGWTICEACRAIEGGYKDRSYCPNCEEPLDL